MCRLCVCAHAKPTTLVNLPSRSQANVKNEFGHGKVLSEINWKVSSKVLKLSYQCYYLGKSGKTHENCPHKVMCVCALYCQWVNFEHNDTYTNAYANAPDKFVFISCLGILCKPVKMMKNNQVAYDFDGLSERKCCHPLGQRSSWVTALCSWTS